RIGRVIVKSIGTFQHLWRPKDSGSRLPSNSISHHGVHFHRGDGTRTDLTSDAAWNGGATPVLRSRAARQSGRGPEGPTGGTAGSRLLLAWARVQETEDAALTTRVLERE